MSLRTSKQKKVSNYIFLFFLFTCLLLLFKKLLFIYTTNDIKIIKINTLYKRKFYLIKQIGKLNEDKFSEYRKLSRRRQLLRSSINGINKQPKNV